MMGGDGKPKKYSVSEMDIVECVIGGDWKERGLAHILITRRVPDGTLLVGGYFVDLLCLGLKDTAQIKDASDEDYAENIKNNIFNETIKMVKCKPELAKAIIEGAIEFAGQYGFRPNKRWDKTRILFSGVGGYRGKLTFGRDSKPCFVDRGETNVKAIIMRLERKAGEGNFTVEKEEKG